MWACSSEREDRRHFSTVGSRPRSRRAAVPLWWGALLLVLASGAACDGCDKLVGGGDTPMCGPCAHSAECRRGLACVNRVCETAPPSCHVKIGL
jgi:hypothetical protein